MNSNNSLDVYDFYPLKYLSNNQEQKVGLIILNQYIGDCMHHINSLWPQAVIKGIADGGINRLHQACLDSNQDLLIPDYINGDFDSASDELLTLYSGKGVEVLHTPDQDKTDFTKCLEIMLEKIKTSNIEIDSLVVLAALGGRFDHQMANINTLVIAQSLTTKPIYLQDKHSLAVALRPARNCIYHKSSYRDDWCGLIPLQRSTVTTSGLKWNLTNDIMEYGSLVSTSNKTDDSFDYISVEADHTIIWTMGIV